MKPDQKGGARPHPQQHHPVPQGPPFLVRVGRGWLARLPHSQSSVDWPLQVHRKPIPTKTTQLSQLQSQNAHYEIHHNCSTTTHTRAHLTFDLLPRPPVGGQRSNRTGYMPTYHHVPRPGPAPRPVAGPAMCPRPQVKYSMGPQCHAQPEAIKPALKPTHGMHARLGTRPQAKLGIIGSFFFMPHG